MILRELFALFDEWNRLNREPGTRDFYRYNLWPVIARYGEEGLAAMRPVHLLAFRGTWHRIMSVQRPVLLGAQRMSWLRSIHSPS